MAAVCTQELTVETQLCVQQSPSHYVSLQETTLTTACAYTATHNAATQNTENRRQQASFVTQCLRIPTCSTEFGYILIPNSFKSTPHISSYRDRAKSHTANIREFAWKKASISVQKKKKKKSNSAQGLFFNSFTVLFTWKECQFL